MRRLKLSEWRLSCIAGLLVLSLGAFSQDNPYGTQSNASDQSSENGNQSGGPVRLARFSFIQGGVTWRPDDSSSWSDASVNLPFRQGTQIWLDSGSRAVVQFDDGSVLCLGDNALISFDNMYSDSNGEFTELRLTSGLASLNLRNSMSQYQVDTPQGSVKSAGPSNLRINAVGDLQVAVRSGQAHVEDENGAQDMNSGDFVDLPSSNSSFDVQPLPDKDSFDRFADERSFGTPRHHHLPPNIALVGGDLDNYGDWSTSGRYGDVWRPREMYSGWRPYHDGSWTWVQPFGWTWVSNEPWGWAPYHYGTWIRDDQGWGWVPGPAQQYWSPAVVSFSNYNGGVAWVPLAPAEVHYPPALNVGLRIGNLYLAFSIGGAASYYPNNNGYCEARPYNNNYVNRVTNVTNITNVYNNTTVVNNYNTTVINNFHPANAAYGGTMASHQTFVSGGKYEKVTNPVVFRTAIAPARGSRATAGPAIAPTRASITPTRTVSSVRPPATLLQRPVLKQAVSATIAAHTSNLAVIKTLPTKSTISTASTTKPKYGKAGPISSSTRPRQDSSHLTTIPVGSTRTGTTYHRAPLSGTSTTQPLTGHSVSNTVGRSSGQSHTFTQRQPVTTTRPTGKPTAGGLQKGKTGKPVKSTKAKPAVKKPNPDDKDKPKGGGN